MKVSKKVVYNFEAVINWPSSDHPMNGYQRSSWLGLGAEVLSVPICIHGMVWSYSTEIDGENKAHLIYYCIHTSLTHNHVLLLNSDNRPPYPAASQVLFIGLEEYCDDKRTPFLVVPRTRARIYPSTPGPSVIIIIIIQHLAKVEGMSPIPRLHFGFCR
jgi:hypothetical protein